MNSEEELHEHGGSDHRLNSDFHEGALLRSEHGSHPIERVNTSLYLLNSKDGDLTCHQEKEDSKNCIH